ncbi:hypothetical protein B1B04_12595 [Lysinibacillus sp. KCTC 33748]|nr:hypothetical protein B1B04_12595 [Lysinibacillus sp. KCTC 33748]
MCFEMGVEKNKKYLSQMGWVFFISGILRYQSLRVSTPFRSTSFGYVIIKFMEKCTLSVLLKEIGGR